MAVGNILKEYLVSVGWKNSGGFNEVQGSLTKVESLLKKVKAAAPFVAVGSALVTANKAMFDYVVGLANADRNNERLARSMWTTKENAEAVNTSLSALGATMEDLWWSPEIRSQFQQLRKESLSLRPPDDYSGQMKDVRSLMFEFSRMKVTLQYAGQWVAYYFLKYVEAPMKRAKQELKGLNDNLQLKLPEATKKVATAASWVFRLGAAGLKTILQLGGSLINWLRELPPEIKIVGGVLASVFSISKFGTIGWIAAAIVALLALLDDYQTWEGGGRSLFDWTKVSEGIDQIKEAFADSDIQESILNISQSIGSMGESIKDAAIEFDNFLQQQTGLNTFELTLKGIVALFSQLANFIELVTNTLGSYVNFGSSLLNGDLSGMGNSVKQWYRGFGDFFSGTKDNIKGFLDFDAAKETAPQAGNTTNNRVTNNDVTMYVTGSDAAGTAAAVKDSLADITYSDGAVTAPY